LSSVDRGGRLERGGGEGGERSWTGVAVGLGVELAIGVGVGVDGTVAVGIGVGVEVVKCAQYPPPVFR
jgi:hypothetical protein